MEHQYPGAISGDENMLAELMLPDQAHVRNQDWTIFFLHKDTSEEDEQEAPANEDVQLRLAENTADLEATEVDEEFYTPESTDEEEAKKETGAPEEIELEGGEGPPLIYVLNLVNTKQDTNAKRFCALNRLLSLESANMTIHRGAVVKAMAICTRHSFLHIYKVACSLRRVLSVADCGIATFITSS